MREPNALEQQQYQRLREIFTLARNRYLEAGGNPHAPAGGYYGRDYLSAEEKQEIIDLGRRVFPLGTLTAKAG